MDAPPVALVSLLTTDRRLIYRPVHHLTSICQSGAWTKTLKLTKSTMSASAFGYTSGWTTQQHDFCALSYFYLEDNRNQHCELKEDPINSGTWRLRADDASCRAVCVDF